MTSTSGGEAIVNGLVAHGVDTVFGLPGAQIYGLFDAFHQAQLKVIGARHEQACGYMAFGYARSSGKPGVFSVVPGPGVLNASAALLTAFGCNEPVLCLTGQVPTQFLGKGRGHLHEMPDQLATLRTFVKWADRIEYPDNAPALVSRALPGNAVGPARPGFAGDAVGCLHPAHSGRSRQAVRSVAGAAARSGPHQGGRRPDRRQQGADDLRRQRRHRGARGDP
ncbi:thiamine pyrophosphate-dependent acetolactate synthase large subunit-like protein [Bradyrhizobium elkanii]